MAFKNVRKPGGKKTVGTGGKNRKALKGKGPTPKAKDRPAHVKYRDKKERNPKNTRTAQFTKEPRRSFSNNEKRSASDFILGRNPVLEALKENVDAAVLRIANGVDVDDRLRQILTLASDKNLPVMEVERRELDRLTNNTNHQGVALAVSPYKYPDLKEVLAHTKTTPLLVILDGVTDPRNLGAVIRSAAGFYANAVVVAERRSAGVTGAVWKTAAGALSHVPVCQVVNITRTITDLQEKGFFAVALDGDGDMNLEQVDPDLANRPLILVIGAEGRGVSRLVAQTCDLRVQIPMSKKIESLNAAVATGVALYSITRSRKLD